MSSFSPSPQNPYVPTPMRTRVKWENISIILVGVAMAAGAVMFIMSGETTKPPAKPAAAPATLDAAPPAESEALTDDLSLEDSLGLVDEARSLMLDARWDDAADRLASVPDQFRVETGADTIATDLAATKVRWDGLTAKLETQVEQEAWTGAAESLRSLAAMARLDNELTATKVLVDEQLAPGAKAPAKPAATPAVTGGGAAATATTPATKPAAAKPVGTKPATAKPATAKPTAAKPTATATPAATGGGAAANGTGTNTAAAAAAAGIDSTMIDQQLLDQINLALEGALAEAG